MKRVQITMPFLIMWAAILFLDTERICVYFLLAAAVHELGHIWAIRLCGGQILHFRLGALGGLIRYYLPHKTVSKEVLICISGCLFGMMLSCVSASADIPLLCGASTILTLFNLLPLPYLDGGRALCLLIGECRLLLFLEYFTVSLLFCLGFAAAICWHAYGLMLMAALPAILQQSALHHRKNKGMIDI